MVRSCMILPPSLNSRPKSRVVNQIDSSTAAGIFIKVPSKPTNHSKFTGKCGRARCTTCHTHPACKSRDKAKGTHKVKSLVDRGLGLKFGGSSAAGILGLLSDRDWDDEVDEQEDYHVADEEEAMTYTVAGEASLEKDRAQDLSIEQEDQHLHSSPIQETETDMGFHDLGFVLDLMEDVEEWCLIGDI
ncbi:uncharacterized protein [Aristolochia californica]|uniref:uncharacterized protein n=1 Tax=Aristolochia californica TaxID=171875 RepID=UPI0035DF6FF4